jgi:dipeptidyl aminopeptidase/acylaminoacyl peptidase
MVAQALTSPVGTDVTGAGQFAIAATGTLAWLPGAVAPYPDTALVTVDRRGHISPLPAPVRSYAAGVRLSPDGRRLAVLIFSLTERGLWLYDVSRGTLTPLSRSGEAHAPLWSPDGQRLLFRWLFADGRRALASQPADGSAPPRALIAGEVYPSSFTPDGRQVAAVTGLSGVVIVTTENGQARAQPLTQTPQVVDYPEFSPDGHWLAYGSDVSGRGEVYVQPYPGPGRAEPVSVEGGSNPAWHPNGREIFFLSEPDPAGKVRMMAVDFMPGSPPRIGRPRPLFEFDNRDVNLGGFPLRSYDVTPDGQRFVAVQRRTPPRAPAVTHINLILNWVEELKAKVPTGR